MDIGLTMGMKFTAYYPEEHDGQALAQRLRSRLTAGQLNEDAYKLEYASSASTFLYLYVIKQEPNWSPSRLMRVLRDLAHAPYMQYHPDSDSNDAASISSRGA